MRGKGEKISILKALFCTFSLLILGLLSFLREHREIQCALREDQFAELDFVSGYVT